MHILVTGGAGFIGSHLIDALMEQGHHVVCLDNFSSGRREFIAHRLEQGLKLVEGDLLNPNHIRKAIKGCDLVYHLAANPDVRRGAEDTNVHLEQNILATYNLLEEMRRQKIATIGFTSSSTVYGEAKEIPTPESYGPLVPISLYGASKLAAEALISSYCHTFDLTAVLYRFANVVGPRSTHGVTYDFVNKLRADPLQLEILGDGTQKKSYLYIEDCIQAMLFAMDNRQDRVEIFNMGSQDWVDVRTIADIVAQEMNLSPSYVFTGGVDGGRGWKGDVKIMRLAIDKLRQMGWEPSCGSAEAIRRTARWIIESL
ncbi:MAG: NAD-dependent epimerase/dehydratase family protein [Thermoplasmatota archaeon]